MTDIESVGETAQFVKTNPFIFIGVGLVGGAIGAFVGYKLAIKKLETKYEEILKEDLERNRAALQAMYKTDFPTPAEAVSQFIGVDAVAASKAIKDYQGRGGVAYDKIISNAKVVEATVLSADKLLNDKTPIVSVVELDMDSEIARRDSEIPYVISRDEFEQNAPEYAQSTFTYYMKDDTTVDEQDEVVHDIDQIVGSDNLTRFGHGSRDPNVVCVRNDVREMDYEIIRSERSYAEDVLGLEHSNQPLRRFRLNRDD